MHVCTIGDILYVIISFYAKSAVYLVKINLLHIILNFICDDGVRVVNQKGEKLNHINLCEMSFPLANYENEDMCVCVE